MQKRTRKVIFLNLEAVVADALRIVGLPLATKDARAQIRRTRSDLNPSPSPLEIEGLGPVPARSGGPKALSQSGLDLW
jgi:hypothetical protein